MALAAYLVLLGLVATCVLAGGPGRRHFRGPLIHGRGLLPLIPLRPLPPPFLFHRGPRRYLPPVPLPFVNRHISDLAQPFPFTSYQTPFGGPQLIDNRAGISIPLRGSIGDFGFDAGSNAAAAASAAAGGLDFLGGGSAAASAAAAAGVSGGGGLSGLDYIHGANAAAAAAAASGVGGYDGIGGGIGSASAVASVSSSAGGAGGIDLIGGGPTVIGFNDNRGGFDSGIGGLVVGGDRRDYGIKKIGYDNGFDNGYDNGGRRSGYDNGYDNGGRRSGYDNGYDNGRLRGRYDNGRDDNGWKYGRGDGLGSVVVDGGDTTVVHISRPGDNGFVGTGAGNAYGTRVTYDGGPDAFGSAAASASASAATSSAVTGGAGGVGGGLGYDAGLIDFFPGQGQGVGTAAATASASAVATSGTSGAGFAAPKIYESPAVVRQSGPGAYNPNIVVVSGNDDGKVKVVV